jgi:hypothetical protein
MNNESITVKLRRNKELYIGVFYKQFHNLYFTYYFLHLIKILRVTANNNTEVHQVIKT